MRTLWGRLRPRASERLYRLLDRLYTPRDRKHLTRTRALRLIPGADDRRGGKKSFAEWAYVIGIFQTLMFQHLQGNDNTVLDIGCGTGLLGIASEAFVDGGGRYVGIDVSREHIDICRTHYPSSFEFMWLDTSNAMYAPSQSSELNRWEIADDSVDLVTALSVWTHLDEKTARFYMGEIRRVLKPGAKAMVTAFILDADYEASLARRSTAVSRYHLTPQSRWVFSKPAYESSICFCPAWAARTPELAIGITRAGLDELLAQSTLTMTELYPGNWREAPGLYFQDVLVLQRD